VRRIANFIPTSAYVSCSPLRNRIFELTQVVRCILLLSSSSRCPASLRRDEPVCLACYWKYGL